MVRYDTYCDTGITIRYVSRYIYYPLIYEMQNCVIEVSIRIYYNIWGNTYHDTIFSLVIRIVGAVYRYIVIHWWIVTSLVNMAFLSQNSESFSRSVVIGLSKWITHTFDTWLYVPICTCMLLVIRMPIHSKKSSLDDFMQWFYCYHFLCNSSFHPLMLLSFNICYRYDFLFETSLFLYILKIVKFKFVLLIMM